MKKSVRFYQVSVIGGEDCQPCGHKFLYKDAPRLDARNGELRDSISEELKLHIMEKKIRVEKAARELLKNYQKKVGYEFNFGNAEEFGDEDDEDDAASYASSDLFELDNLSSIGEKCWLCMRQLDSIGMISIELFAHGLIT